MTQIKAKELSHQGVPRNQIPLWHFIKQFVCTTDSPTNTIKIPKGVLQIKKQIKPRFQKQPNEQLDQSISPLKARRTAKPELPRATTIHFRNRTTKKNGEVTWSRELPATYTYMHQNIIEIKKNNSEWTEPFRAQQNSTRKQDIKWDRCYLFGSSELGLCEQENDDFTPQVTRTTALRLCRS